MRQITELRRIIKEAAEYVPTLENMASNAVNIRKAQLDPYALGSNNVKYDSRLTPADRRSRSVEFLRSRVGADYGNSVRKANVSKFNIFNNPVRHAMPGDKYGSVMRNQKNYVCNLTMADALGQGIGDKPLYYNDARGVRRPATAGELRNFMSGTTAVPEDMTNGFISIPRSVAAKYPGALAASRSHVSMTNGDGRVISPSSDSGLRYTDWSLTNKFPESDFAYAVPYHKSTDPMSVVRDIYATTNPGATPEQIDAALRNVKLNKGYFHAYPAELYTK